MSAGSIPSISSWLHAKMSWCSTSSCYRASIISAVIPMPILAIASGQLWSGKICSKSLFAYAFLSAYSSLVSFSVGMHCGVGRRLGGVSSLCCMAQTLPSTYSGLLVTSPYIATRISFDCILFMATVCILTYFIILLCPQVFRGWVLISAQRTR